MDQQLQGSPRPSSDLMDEELSSDPDRGQRVQGSAMVLVLGLVSVISMIFGFLLGLLF